MVYFFNYETVFKSFYSAVLFVHMHKWVVDFYYFERMSIYIKFIFFTGRFGCRHFRKKIGIAVF